MRTSAKRRSAFHRWAWLALVVFTTPFSSALGGCDVLTSVGPKSCDSKPEDNPPAKYVEGTVQGGVYASSPWDKNLLYFPGGMVISLEHKLGATPTEWHAYLSFDADGVAHGGVVAEAAGNQVELVSATSEWLTVRNATCADYWLIVTADAASPK